MTDRRKVTELNIRSPNAGLVTHLEQLLEQARTGELTGITYVAIWHGNFVNHSWYNVPRDRFRTVMGEAVIMAHELLEAERE